MFRLRPFLSFMAAASAIAMMPVAPTLPRGRGVTLLSPEHRRYSYKRGYKAWKFNTSRWRSRRVARMEARRGMETNAVEWRALFEKLTNWQRHQWTRDGRPGFRERKVELLAPYLVLTRGV